MLDASPKIARAAMRRPPCQREPSEQARGALLDSDQDGPSGPDPIVPQPRTRTQLFSAGPAGQGASTAVRGKLLARRERADADVRVIQVASLGGPVQIDEHALVL